jgi:HSP20 family protein
MRCQRHDYSYELTIESNRSFDAEWQTGNIHVMLARNHWCPATDIYETDDKIYVTVEIAGVDHEKLEISVYEDAIVVEGERFLKPAPKKRLYHMAEIRQGTFCLEFPLLLPVDADPVDVHYENGLLSIILKKIVE